MDNGGWIHKASREPYPSYLLSSILDEVVDGRASPEWAKEDDMDKINNQKKRKKEKDKRKPTRNRKGCDRKIICFYFVILMTSNIRNGVRNNGKEMEKWSPATAYHLFLYPQSLPLSSLSRFLAVKDFSLINFHRHPSSVPISSSRSNSRLLYLALALKISQIEDKDGWNFLSLSCL